MKFYTTDNLCRESIGTSNVITGSKLNAFGEVRQVKNFQFINSKICTLINFPLKKIEKFSKFGKFYPFFLYSILFTFVGIIL